MGAHGKIVPLADAVRRFVTPGAWLHFASTPVRSNAAIREVSRAFRGTSPAFTISTTGFHSHAHLLGLLRLGRRYVSCFFGDNWPTPRPNPLWTEIAKEGASLEHWSLLSYVLALRAGALGHGWAVVRPFGATTLGEELQKAGRYREVPDPEDPARAVGLVAAMRPDVVFVHAALGDPDGSAVASAPLGEGTWAALAAKRGVIVTVEQAAAARAVARLPEALRIPASRVLAVCVEPFGAHPQPLFTTPSIGLPGYADDFDAYVEWRKIATDPAAFARFDEAVLRAPDGGAAYRAFVGPERLAALTVRGSAPRTAPTHPRRPRIARRAVPPKAGDVRTILAARRIVERVNVAGHRVVLAGIGHAYQAARLAEQWLSAQGRSLAVLVETGLTDLDCGPAGDSFLLGFEAMSGARRLTSVEDVLGALACGADNGCLAVVGAAQIDEAGDLNSTRLADGRILVGAGGAHDVASGADEVLVLSACEPERLVRRVDYKTSPGRAVRHVVTERGTLRRAGPEAPWQLVDLHPAAPGQSFEEARDAVRGRCPWAYEVPGDAELTPPVSASEIESLQALASTLEIERRAA